MNGYLESKTRFLNGAFWFTQLQNKRLLGLVYVKAEL
jgi:hypothetical protein